MKITELYIRGFGKLKDLSLLPADGFNVIYGENESGKTTLMTFIRACFYGVGGKNDLREKYRPHDGSPMSGYVVFEHNGVCYKLDRTFGTTASKDITELWNITAGKQENLPLKTSVGEYLFGITEHTFVSTVYIGQANLSMDKNSDEILKKLNNLTASNDEDISYTEVNKRLSDAAKIFKSRSQDCIINRLNSEKLTLISNESELKDKCAGISARIDNFSNEKLKLDEINNKISQTEKLRELSSVNEKSEKLNNICKVYERLENAETALKNAKEKIIFHENAVTHDDIREKAAALKHSELLDAEIGRIEENLTAIESRKNELEHSLTAYPEIAENIENINQLDALYNDRTAEEKFNNSKKAIGFNAITLMLSITLLVLGLILYKQFGILSIIVGIISSLTVFVIGCTIKVKPKIKYKQELENKNRQFIEECKCSTIEELHNKAYQIQKDKMQLDAVLLQYNKVAKIISDKKTELAQTDNEIDEFFNEFKDGYFEFEPEELLDIIDDNISSYEEAEHNVQYCKNELERTIEGKNIDDIKNELANAERFLNEHSEIPVKNPPEYYNNLLSDLNSQKNEITKKIALLSVSEKELDETQKLLEENNVLINENEAKLQNANEEFSAFLIAIDVLEQSFEEMQKNFSPIVNRKTGEILSSLTNGKYNDIYISKTLSPAVNAPEDNRLYETGNFSGGTVDQIYLALRLAISDVILNDISLPLMLDDSLSQFDNSRAESAARYIYNSGSQIFMFTCRKEDANLIRNLGANLIEL